MDLLDVGSCVFTIENYYELLAQVEAVRDGTILVKVIKEACVMLLEVEPVRYRDKGKCLRFVANVNIFTWTKVDDLIKESPTLSLDVIAVDFVDPIICQLFKHLCKFHNALCAYDYLLSWRILDHFLYVLSCDDN